MPVHKLEIGHIYQPTKNGAIKSKQIQFNSIIPPPPKKKRLRENVRKIDMNIKATICNICLTFVFCTNRHCIYGFLVRN